MLSHRASTESGSRVSTLIDNPFAVFAITLIAQWGAALIGDLLRRTFRPLKKDERDDFDTVLTATLTLLALIIGVSFSMAVTRYDQRKNYEEVEAIGTQYLRADLLPAETAGSVRQFLKAYVEQRINFYNTNGQAADQAGAILPRRRARFGRPWSTRRRHGQVLFWRWPARRPHG
jgi:hypothetical protein